MSADFPAFALTEEHQALREAVRELADDKIAPRAAEVDESGEFPWDVFQALAKADFASSGAKYPKAGYVFYCISKDKNGTSYGANAERKFGFAAQPVAYGKTGIRSFVVNEEGVIYGKDLGSSFPLGGIESYPGTVWTSLDE